MEGQYRCEGGGGSVQVACMSVQVARVQFGLVN